MTSPYLPALRGSHSPLELSNQTPFLYLKNRLYFSAHALPSANPGTITYLDIPLTTSFGRTSFTFVKYCKSLAFLLVFFFFSNSLSQIFIYSSTIYLFMFCSFKGSPMMPVKNNVCSSLLALAALIFFVFWVYDVRDFFPRCCWCVPKKGGPRFFFFMCVLRGCSGETINFQPNVFCCLFLTVCA